MTPKQICQRLYDSSPGILAVGITSSIGREGEFVSEPDPVRPWRDLFADAYRMFHTAHRHRKLNRLTVRFDRFVVEIERHDEWFIVVGIVMGHDVRKRLRRLVRQASEHLKQKDENKVISLFPGKPGAARPQGKGNRNLKPG